MTIDRAAMTAAFHDAIDRLEQALAACRDDRWEASVWPVPRTDPWVWPAPGVTPVPERTDESIQAFSAFWGVAYHTLWFLDFYASINPTGFESPDYIRGGPEELGFADDGAVALPGPSFTRDALLAYVAHGRTKVTATLADATEAELATPMPGGHPWAGTTLADLLRVNLNHVVDHGSRLAEFAAAPT